MAQLQKQSSQRSLRNMNDGATDLEGSGGGYTDFDDTASQRTSNSGSGSGTYSDDRDEVAEIKKVIQRETKVVKNLRVPRVSRC